MSQQEEEEEQQQEPTKKLEEKTFEKLEKKKKSHSKVKNLEHNRIVIQKYLQPNSEKYSKEDAQLIFRLRGNMTNVKTNMKGNYDQLECRACDIKEEDQKHVYECKLLNKKVSEIEYEKIYTGTVYEKVKVAQKFRKNLEMLEQADFGV